MTELLPFLKDLISAPGLSGYEGPVARIIEDKWRPFVHEISRGKLGSLHGLRRASPSLSVGFGPTPSIMIATHMDAIGLMVTGIRDGFLRVTQVGDMDARTLPGTLVTIQGRETIPGVVVQPPACILPSEIGEDVVPLEHLLVDTGLLPKKIAELVHIGDLVSFAQPPLELAGEVIVGHSLDNRASVAALTVCLEELQSRPHVWDVWAVATSQEEIGAIGASGSAFELHPTIAIAVDVTWAKGPGDSDWRTFPLGKGPTIAMGPNLHPALHRAMKDLADKLEIPYALEYTPRHTGTDAEATQITAEGIPTMLVEIPLRYMHTTVEVVAIKDIQRLGRLLAEFVAGLEPDFMEKIVWDEGKK